MLIAPRRFLVAFVLIIVGCHSQNRNEPAATIEGAKAQPESVRVLVAGDSRGNAGFADILSVARNVTHDHPVTALITPGDMDPIPTTRQQIASVFGEATPGTPQAGKGIIWYPVVGNHEAESTNAMRDMRSFYQGHLAKITTPGPQGTQETTYSFDLGSMHIAVLNEYWNGKATTGSDAAIRDAVVPSLRTWLERDLKASKKPFKIVVGHEPAYPQVDQDFHEGRHADSSLNAREGERDAFWKVLEQQKATMLLCGHTHRYSRFRPEGSKVWQVDGAQARNNATWKFDAFVILTATDQTLRLETYRHLKEQDRWEVTDSLAIRSDGTEMSSLRPEIESGR